MKLETAWNKNKREKKNRATHEGKTKIKKDNWERERETKKTKNAFIIYLFSISLTVLWTNKTKIFSFNLVIIISITKIQL